MLTHLESIRRAFKRWQALPVPRHCELIDSKTLERFLRSAAFAGKQNNVDALWKVGHDLDRNVQNAQYQTTIDYYYMAIGNLYKALYSCLTTQEGFNAPYHIGEANRCITEILEYGVIDIEVW